MFAGGFVVSTIIGSLLMGNVSGIMLVVLTLLGSANLYLGLKK